VICGLSKSSNRDDLGCIYCKVICRLQSFSNGIICSCNISTDKRDSSAVAEVLVLRVQTYGTIVFYNDKFLICHLNLLRWQEISANNSNTSLMFNAPQCTIDATQLQHLGWIVMHGIRKYTTRMPFQIRWGRYSCSLCRYRNQQSEISQ